MSPPVLSDLGYVPPDGGWGWAVVFGASISIGFAFTFPKAFTIYFRELQAAFSISYSQIAWTTSIMCATTYGGGPISSILVNRYGSRPVVMFGGLLCGVGMISAAFCTSILQLYICVGFITGLGLALNLQPSVIIIGKYFLKRRPIANGLAMAGSPVMLCTLAPLNQFLFENFGWRGSFLILGAILLNCCVAGALFRPVGAAMASAKTQDALTGKITEDAMEMSSPKNVPMENKTEEGGKDCCEKINQYLDFSLFKHRGFLIYLIGNVLMFLGFFAPIVFLAPYAKHTGIDEYSAAFLLSILAIVDMVARPTTGIIANSKWVRPRIQYFFSFAIAFNGACHLLCPLASSYTGLVVYSSFFGLAFGMVCAMLFETLMDLVGAARFTSAVGLVTIAECCTILLGPPIGGTLIDTFGDYKYMFIKCGAVMVLAGTFLFIMNYYNYCMLAKEEKEKKTKEEDPKSVRTENEGRNNWNKDTTQVGPELEPLREEQEGVKKEINGTNEV
ncbi:monocarboxylate transporter 2-like isoform X1 [Manacus candei]|uniref:monocarboxylate transporter 2-like isoform X1 n=1 Tax=Manacus candei TaxID=415023 RepID=UPI002227CC91|nr:monocarboxylate transporter 2-like isoform X1 [Manacus candei]XP_051644765.1 monocarboxylate transporter 2-like isoform X1 [Manacus candei]XP_051644767.1 monocarboxylate transporter 2-like isoform X1 [Manacus candei]XP_051644768.1 monocarboxylate transporter 2-like isoform X1 [Manacus candei]XP_051644769.1 monocarboxylate transporter 2-like isoform X1 [Manacus candei]XP_051644770.1 monocarboxylate transporter 2-like isoform X1 [Manacus candei]XP_051644771.1 monocarboxylate transporter 2-li